MASSSETNDGEEGPLAFGKKRKKDDEVDITPMIDITFLLLIFFVVCSKMDPSQTGAVPDAEYGGGVATNDSAVILMERGTGERAIIKRGNGDKFFDDPDQQGVEVIDYINQQMALGKKYVMIVGNKDVTVGEVARVQRIIGDGFENVQSTHIAVKQE